MAEIALDLQQRGYSIDKPNIVEGHVYEDNLDANAILKRNFIDEHFNKINTADAILVVNEHKNGIDNYIGGNTLIEISHAYAQGLDIFLLNPVPDVSYDVEIRGMHPIVLDGNLDNIDSYLQSLPLVYMSTESALKHSAVSRAMRRAGIPVRVEGKKVDSGVNEQPMTLDETYDGAINRHKRIREVGVEASYYATVESGLHKVHDAHGTYGCTVILIQPHEKPVVVGFDMDVEFPEKWLQQVPSEYADMGVLVQAQYDATEKDPLTVLTNKKLSRKDVIEQATYRVAVRMLGEN